MVGVAARAVDFHQPEPPEFGFWIVIETGEGT